MGCKGSKATSDATFPPHKDELTSSGRNRRTQGLTKTEILQRIDCADLTKQFQHDGIILNYAWVSQRGFYPDSPDKDNQDAYRCIPDFGRTVSGSQMSYFGIYDGHGKDGHHCARFARDRLHVEIAKKMDKLEQLPANTSEAKLFQEIRHCLELAHLSTNHQMKADRKFDSELSGTTSISVLIRDRHLFVSNVGDSRAIIVSESTDGHMAAKPLSSDQTPYRADERARVKKYGARVLSMDQIEGIEPHHENWGDLTLGEDIDEGGDPPRIWHPRENYPGTAFTRSLGDSIAELLGVVAEPEVLERELTDADRFIIIASDGVFEFLTNQMVADLAVQHKDPIVACKAIVDVAYNMWLQYEVRTDDITIIMIAIDNGSEGFNAVGRTSRTSSLSKDEQPVLDSKPVRRAVSKEKKKNMIQTKSEEGDDGIDESDMAALQVPKTPEDEEAIAGAIKSNFLFQHLNAVQRQAVIGVMQPVQVTKGEWVITQDDRGDRFYVVDSGRYEVRVRPAGKVDPSGGFVVHVYESGNGQHPGFGELSLMYGKPRAASVIALEDGKLWALDRRVFKGVVMRSMDVRKDTIRALRTVPLFKPLSLQQLQRLADMMNDENYSEGVHLVEEGVHSDMFYLIVSGEVQVLKNGVVVKTMRENDFIGERNLMEDAPPVQETLLAQLPARARVISRTSFENSIGSIEEITATQNLRLENLKKSSIQGVPKSFKEIELHAVVNADNLSHLLLGSFGTLPHPIQATVRSFMLSDVDATGLSASVFNTIETGRIIASQQVQNVFAPRLLQIYREPNALHLLFEAPIITDLYSLVHPPQPADEAGSPKPPAPPAIMVESEIIYVAACLASALETLHGIGIVYRGIQPEGILLTTEGKVVLMDYRVCKVGGVGARSFTICGAADYLAPEQISQQGHGAPVDLWALGVLLYELIIGTTPFSANSEVATYSKISSFGSTAFPCLLYPESSDDVPAPSFCLKSLINRCLVPAPEARIGATGRGFEDIKSHSFFKEIHWENIDKVQSPLFFRLAEETTDMLHYGLRDHMEIIETFSRPFRPAGVDWTEGIDRLVG